MAKSISRRLADSASPTGAIDGTLSTAAQTNITSVGTLSALAVSGTSTMGAMNVTSGLASGTGIGASGANGNLRLYSSGAQVVTVDTTGNVGIGTTSPNSYSGYTALTLNHATNGGLLDFELNGNLQGEIYANSANLGLGLQAIGNRSIQFETNGTVRTTILGSGNFGIGTSAPSYPLEVAGAAGDGLTITARSGDATAANNAGGGFRNTGSATATSRKAQVWLDADGANLTGGDYFYIEKKGNSGDVIISQYSNADMIFHVYGGNERMRIDASGNVGIGNTIFTSARVNAPHLVVGSGSNSPGLTLYGATNAQASINFADSTSGTGSYDGGLVYGFGSGSPYLTFHVNGATERMRIDASGNVGIGATPEAWKSDWEVLRIGPEASFYSQATATAGIGENIYYNNSNSWRAITTGPSSIYQLDSGAHNFYTMASVSAGAAASPLLKVLIDNAGDTTFYGDVIVHKSGADSVIDVKSNSSHDSVLNLRSDQNTITDEGFQIWYDNSVGDVHLATTYANNAAAIRFHTRTGVNKVGTGTNERLTIRGDGNVEVPDGYLAARQPAAIARGVGGWQTSYTNAGWNELHSIVAFTQYNNSVGAPWSDSTGRFTAPIAGYYLCTLSIYANNGNPGAHATSYVHPQWAKNGAVAIHGVTPYQIYGHDATANNSYADGIGRADIVYCAAGDYITAQLFVNGANWQFYRSYCAISFCLLSAA